MVKILKILLASVLTITASAFLYQSSSGLLSSNSLDAPLLAPKPRSHTSDFAMSSPWSLTRSKQALDSESIVSGRPRMAKDANFANAVVAAWNRDEADMTAKGSRSATASETRLFEYQDSSDGATLYGHVIRRIEKESGETKVPGVLLFHTGAGPHDVSLQWKADSLVSNKEIFPDGCVVLVADILSDDVGWAWDDDRSKYSEARSQVLKGEASGERLLLQSRLRAALEGLHRVAPEVDMTRLCALGWCLGGHNVLELGRMQISGIKAMITFHGVFDGVPPPKESVDASKDSTSEILICHGDLDPFVDKQTNLKYAVDTLKRYGNNVRLLSLDDAKHGFTNPAQEYNLNDAFSYNEAAANLAWSETLALLKSTFS